MKKQFKHDVKPTWNALLPTNKNHVIYDEIQNGKCTDVLLAYMTMYVYQQELAHLQGFEHSGFPFFVAAFNARVQESPAIAPAAAPATTPSAAQIDIKTLLGHNENLRKENEKLKSEAMQMMMQIERMTSEIQKLQKIIHDAKTVQLGKMSASGQLPKQEPAVEIRLDSILPNAVETTANETTTIGTVLHKMRVEQKLQDVPMLNFADGIPAMMVYNFLLQSAPKAVPTTPFEKKVHEIFERVCRQKITPVLYRLQNNAGKAVYSCYFGELPPDDNKAKWNWNGEFVAEFERAGYHLERPTENERIVLDLSIENGVPAVRKVKLANEFIKFWNNDKKGRWLCEMFVHFIDERLIVHPSDPTLQSISKVALEKYLPLFGFDPEFIR